MQKINFPWYNLPCLRADYARLWQRLSVYLKQEAFKDLPDGLDATADLGEVLTAPDLLISQTCGYDIAVDLPLPLTMIYTPSYAAEGCGDGTYRSFIVTRRGLSRQDMNGARLVANDDRSWSGYHCLRHDHHLFKQIMFSGRHTRSLEFLKTGRADFAAIDCVVWALLTRDEPAALNGLYVVGQTDAAPAPPLVSAKSRSPRELSVLRRAFKRLITVEAELCQRLLLRDFVLFEPADYRYMAPPTNAYISEPPNHLSARSGPN